VFNWPEETGGKEQAGLYCTAEIPAEPANKVLRIKEKNGALKIYVGK
jgi:hypothetical protein